MHNQLPQFSKVIVKDIEPQLDQLLSENRKAIADLLGSQIEYGWKNLVQPLDELSDRLNHFWSPVSHLHSVANSEELREVYHHCLPKLSAYATELSQNMKLYLAFRSLAESEAAETLSQEQKQYLKNELRDFRLSGIELDEAKRQRYADIKARLSQLTARFEEHVLDATNAWLLHVEELSRLEGLPLHSLERAKEAAKARNLEGAIITLDFSSYYPFMSYCADRELRHTLYEAYVTRASELGPNAGQFDNAGFMVEILNLRHELANLLDFSNYAERSLATKMASDCDQVIDFLEDLVRKAKPFAEKEYQELTKFAKECGHVGTLEAWDISYYSEKLQQARYAISQEELRPYFPTDKVLQGLFNLTKKLFGVQIKEEQGIDVWHPSVRFFTVYDEANNLRAGFYLDLYARNNKREGAWMDDCIIRRRKADGSIQHPVAYLTCNFSPAVNDKPALLTHDDVITLFHEFGHGLHHMLTQVECMGVSGINGVAWDAVELPSQFMENWCWQEDVLKNMTEHYETKEPLPHALFEKLIKAKNFHTGLFMARQLEFALFDLELHRNYVPGKTNIQEVLDQVRKKVSVIPVPAFNRFQNSFSHIFAGGYAAGYYSYKWAEVLSSDAFSKFEEYGLYDAGVAHSFLENILEKGGSQDAMDLFVAFRGRKPSAEALLRHSGLIATT